MTPLNRIDKLLTVSAQRLVDLLWADLDLGFTFAELAQTEHQLGDPDAVERCRENARSAIETVRKLERLLPSGETQKAIVDRWAELQRRVSSLPKTPSRHTTRGDNRNKERVAGISIEPV
jgi:hypothetical protein